LVRERLDAVLQLRAELGRHALVVGPKVLAGLATGKETGHYGTHVVDAEGVRACCARRGQPDAQHAKHNGFKVAEVLGLVDHASNVGEWSRRRKQRQSTATYPSR